MDFEVAEDGEQGLAILEASDPAHFQLILLDVEMPKASGMELLIRLRECSNELPVIFVSGVDTTEQRVLALRMGADDYINKPVEYEELIARIEAVLRRRNALPIERFGDLTIDLALRRVERAGSAMELSPREYDLLLAIMRAQGETLSRSALLREVWDIEFDTGTNLVDVHVGRLRKKLNRFGANVIETVRGSGYRSTTD